MSTSEIDEFVDAFLDRVTADGDVKKASAAIQLFLADVKGMKKQALSSPSLFGPETSPKPKTGFSPSPLPAPAAAPPSPGLQPIRQLAPSNLYSGTAMDLPTAAANQNKLRGFTPPPPLPSALPTLGASIPALLPKPVEPAEEPNWRAFYGRPDSATRPSVMKAQMLQGAKRQADSARYSDASAAARGERELVDQGRAWFAEQDAKQQAAAAAESETRRAAAAGARGRWQGMVNKYMGDVRQRVQQQNAASDVAGKAKTFLRGLPAAAVRGLTTAGRPDQAAFESRTVNAAKIKELEGALSERATNYDKQEAAQTTAFDSRVNDEAAAVRARLAALNKRIDTGPIPAFKNIPQLTPVNNVGEQDLAEREKLQSDLAALGKLRIRKEAPAGVPGLAEQRTQLLASQARNRARTQAQTTMPSAVRAPVAPSAPAVPARPAAQPVLASAQPSYSIRPGGDGIIKLQSARILKKASFGSAVGEAGTKAYDWTAGKLAGGLDSVSNFAKSSPGTYGAGLGALVGAGWTALAPRRKDGSKPWLRNLLIGGALGGALTGGLSYLSKMAPKPATTNLNPPQVK